MPVEDLVIRRLIPAPPAAVYEAWTSPELMARWFFAGGDWTTKAEADLRIGGSYSVAMHASDGKVHTMSGTYQKLEPPFRLAFTWNADMADGKVRDSLVVIEFLDKAGATEMILTHKALPTNSIRQNHSQGWAGCLDNLEKLLKS